MRRFYYGPRSGISTDSLSYTQVRQNPPQSDHPDTITLFSSEAQICPEPLGLYVRMQDIVLVRAREDLMDFMMKTTWKHLAICPHHHLNHVIPIMETIYHGEAPFATTCYKCSVGLQVEIGAFDFKIAFILTRWINLGRGLTQEDPLWDTRVRMSASWLPRRFNGVAAGIPPTHNPRSCFEDMTPQSLEDLRSRNLSHLKDQQYKVAMSFHESKQLWHISYKEPPKKGRIGSLWSMVRRSAISREIGTVVRGKNWTRHATP